MKERIIALSLLLKGRKINSAVIVSFPFVFFFFFNIFYSSFLISHPPSCPAPRVHPAPYGLTAISDEKEREKERLNCQLAIQSYFQSSDKYSPATKDIFNCHYFFLFDYYFILFSLLFTFLLFVFFVLFFLFFVPFFIFVVIYFLFIIYFHTSFYFYWVCFFYSLTLITFIKFYSSVYTIKKHAREIFSRIKYTATLF